MYEIKLAKERVRAVYMDRRRALPAEVRAARDDSICRRFLALVTYRYAEALLMYAPKGCEIDVSVIAERALSEGKLVAFPRCNPDRCTMDFHIVDDLGQLRKGAYGLYEPPADLPVYNPRALRSAACIVPALVYDRGGFRLGYGKGYYDRYLASFTGVKVGLAYGEFILNRVPRGRFDIAVDVLVTEKGVKALHA